LAAFGLNWLLLIRLAISSRYIFPLLGSGWFSEIDKLQAQARSMVRLHGFQAG